MDKVTRTRVGSVNREEGVVSKEDTDLAVEFRFKLRFWCRRLIVCWCMLDLFNLYNLFIK